MRRLVTVIVVLSVVLIFGFERASAASSETFWFETGSAETGKRKGNLYLPEGAAGKVPAVIVVHGTNGPDGRYDFHRDSLLGSGVATFEVDFKSGIFSGPRDRPQPAFFVPLAYAALKFLKAQPSIDPARIAIMGFSLGGHLSMRTVMAETRKLGTDDGLGFVGHVGFYPGCRYLRSVMNGELTSAPILILAGDQDSYGDGEDCITLVDRLRKSSSAYVDLKIYDGVYHGFNLPNADVTIIDRAAVTPGNRATLRWDKSAAEDARVRVVKFLKGAFGLDGATLDKSALKGSGSRRMTAEDAIIAIDDWLKQNRQLCDNGADSFKDAVTDHIEKLKSDGRIPDNFEYSNFKLKFLHRKFCQ